MRVVEQYLLVGPLVDEHGVRERASACAKHREVADDRQRVAPDRHTPDRCSVECPLYALDQRFAVDPRSGDDDDYGGHRRHRESAPAIHAGQDRRNDCRRNEGYEPGSGEGRADRDHHRAEASCESDRVAIEERGRGCAPSVCPAILHVGRCTHGQVAADGADREHEPGCKVITIDEGPEGQGPRVGSAPDPVDGFRCRRPLRQRDDRARQSHPREDVDGGAAAAASERLARRPEYEGAGERQRERHAGRRRVDAERTPSPERFERIGILQRPSRGREHRHQRFRQRHHLHSNHAEGDQQCGIQTAGHGIGADAGAGGDEEGRCGKQRRQGRPRIRAADDSEDTGCEQRQEDRKD